MKKYIFICLLIIASSCTEKKETKKIKKDTIENLIEYKDGIYTEYYPGRKKIKITGAQDKNKVRDGKWVLLSENGNEMSVTYFEKGLREGHTVVKHPNGKINYAGEYHLNEQVGIWKFYDLKGNLIREENYDKKPVEVNNF